MTTDELIKQKAREHAQEQWMYEGDYLLTMSEGRDVSEMAFQYGAAYAQSRDFIEAKIKELEENIGEHVCQTITPELDRWHLQLRGYKDILSSLPDKIKDSNDHQ